MDAEELNAKLQRSAAQTRAKYGYYEGKSVSWSEFRHEVEEYGLRQGFGDMDVQHHLSVSGCTFREQVVDIGMARATTISEKTFKAEGEALAYLLFRMHVQAGSDKGAK